MRGYLMVVVVCLVIGFATGLPAQVTGQVVGSVVDQSGAAIPGAGVSLFLPDGERAVFTAITNEQGLFNIASVRSGSYNLVVELPGFQKQTIRNVKVDPARDTALAPIRLEVQGVTQEVSVQAEEQTVQANNVTISTIVTNEQVRRLPMMNRSPAALISTQPGVSNGRGNIVINGQRTSYSNVTLDGINIQDNFIRSNALNFLPNLLLLDQIAEVTISTSNTNASFGAGATQVSFVTPSGTNQNHGNVYWYNRNNKLAANTWFNNRDGIARPFLNQNQAGGAIGGPILKDKLLFYGNYEAFRLRQQSTVNRTILTPDARNGIYTYRDSSGTVRKANLLQLGGVSMDPESQKIIAAVPRPENINNYRVGDSSDTLVRNTAGYSFTMRNNRTRDNATGKIDYSPSTRHHVSGTYAWNRDIVDRTDTGVAINFSKIQAVTNDEAINLLSVGWRWSPASAFTNELRGGFNLAPATFNTTEKFGDRIFLIAGAPSATGTGLFTNPLNTFRAQGRYTNTYNFQDQASYWRGKHNLQFGTQLQIIHADPYNDAGITSLYTFGIASGNPAGLTAAQLPGISASDLNTANQLFSTLAGYVTSYSQTFNVKDRNSGFVRGATRLRHYRFNQYGYFLNDTWKTSRRLTLTLGLRYEYLTPVDERDALVLLPKIVNNDVGATLLSNSTLDFAGSSVGKPFYKKDRNNFAPNIGLAYDVTGKGKTVLRAGYSLNYVNDEHIASIQNSVETNSGLSASSTRSGLTARASTGLPQVVVPEYKVPRTFQDNYNLSSSSAFAVPSPDLASPYVQQWSLGFQHDIKGTIVDVRYVGNHGTKEFRAFDLNQVVIRENGFLDDFMRAYNNGNLARARSGVFDPSYNAAIPGSQPLTVFPRLANSGSITQSTNRTLIEQGQVGELAAQYQITGNNGSVNFFRNPVALGANLMTNYGNSTYNALQIDVTRRLRGDLRFQANYTFSKVLSDANGTADSRFEPFLDNANPKFDRARPTFDITHAVKANVVYNIPAGEGHRFNVHALRNVLSGWTISGIFTEQSGGPLSIYSSRSTVNRAARSDSANNGQGANTAVSLLTKAQLDDVVKFRMSGSGPYIVAASAIGADGRGVAADGSTPFSGQAFIHPGPGTLGNLQRRMFNGPWTMGLDFSALKATKIRENQSIEFRMEASNILNHPTWDVGDQNINSTNFGKITNTFYARRLIQFSLQYRF